MNVLLTSTGRRVVLARAFRPGARRVLTGGAPAWGAPEQRAEAFYGRKVLF